MSRATIPQLAGIDLDAFVRAYIAAAYFTDTGEDDQPPTDAELSNEARAAALEDCRAFARAAHPLLREAVSRAGYDSARAGHDFWLTRNGHGAGFWDRTELDADELGDRLTVLAKEFGDVDLYQGDDQLLYLA